MNLESSFSSLSAVYMHVFSSVSRATMTSLNLRTWPLLLPLLPLWDLSNLSWGRRGCQVTKSHRQELSVGWWWFLGMCVHMQSCTCVESRDQCLCTVYCLPHCWPPYLWRQGLSLMDQAGASELQGPCCVCLPNAAPRSTTPGFF